MKNIEFKSLFKIANDLNINDCFDEKLDKNIINDLRKLKSILKNNNYLSDLNYIDLLKKINNFFFVRDIFLLENKFLKLDCLLTSDYKKNDKLEPNKEELLFLIDRFNWLNSWYNFTKINFKSNNINWEIIKYLRKEVNCGQLSRTIWDTEFLEYIEDLLTFLNSIVFDEFPIIKTALIFKQILGMKKILNLDVMVVLLMLIFRKYNLDFHLTINIFVSFIFFNRHNNIDKIVDFYKNMNETDFVLIFKNAYLKSINLSILIANKISLQYKNIMDLKDDEIDYLFGNEFKYLFKSKIGVDYLSLYENGIFLNRHMFRVKVGEFLKKQYLKDISSNSSIFYVNNFIYQIFVDVEKYLDNINQNIMK